jgi:hypothetical protein
MVGGLVQLTWLLLLARKMVNYNWLVEKNCCEVERGGVFNEKTISKLRLISLY